MEASGGDEWKKQMRFHPSITAPALRKRVSITTLPTITLERLPLRSYLHHPLSEFRCPFAARRTPERRTASEHASPSGTASLSVSTSPRLVRPRFDSIFEIGDPSRHQTPMIISIFLGILYDMQISIKSPLKSSPSFKKRLLTELRISLYILRKFGIPLYFLHAIRLIHDESRSPIHLGKFLSSPFKFERGIREGDSLSGRLYSPSVESFLNLMRNRLSPHRLCVR